jgi:hypothetical protein
MQIKSIAMLNTKTKIYTQQPRIYSLIFYQDQQLMIIAVGLFDGTANRTSTQTLPLLLLSPFGDP